MKQKNSGPIDTHSFFSRRGRLGAALKYTPAYYPPNKALQLYNGFLTK